MYMDSRRNLTASSFAVDDRPEEKLSYAAINLVKSGLASRSRQQSEPPIHRNMFPPTPPPEADRAAPASTTTNSKHKSAESAASLPTGMHQSRPSISKPAKLDLGAAAFEQASQSTTSLVVEKPRLGTKRSASERPRARDTHSSQSTSYRARERDRLSDSHQTDNDGPVLRPDVYTPDTGSAAVKQALSEPEKLQPASFHHHHRTRSGGQSLREQPLSIAEEDENPDIDDNSATHAQNLENIYGSPTQSLHSIVAGSLPYEITPVTAAVATPPGPLPTLPTLRKIRVKVFASDTRYVMIQPDVTYSAFVEQIRKKFGYSGPEAFKLKMKDEEGDMVTMGDEDDLEMLMQVTKEVAARDGADMGKMEVSLRSLDRSLRCRVLILWCL